MSRHERHETHCVLLMLAAVLVASVLGAGRAAAQVITEIIDATGDGAGNALDNPYGIAVDGAGNAYVARRDSDSALKIAPPDCNNNGIPDDQDIAGGTSEDCNANGVRDECERGHQPAGALSGVTVFAAASHGWFDDSSGWRLYRSLLYDMIEDYGNLDQLNYFVHYLFNAGATVVPFRPVGYQTEEIVLDQDDPEVTYGGTWSDSTGPVYYENGVTSNGISYRFADASTNGMETATARYRPDVPTADFYPVYTWVADSSDRTMQLYRIVHSGGSTEVIVDHRMVGRGWVWLGNYYFESGTAGYVEISNQSSAGGVVIADAIRFGNGMGDVVGYYSGTVSGYARDEECSRYWAESETYINANGLPSSIFDRDSPGGDGTDNIGTAARWAAAMNNDSHDSNRWRRIYLEFQSLAGGGSARGTRAVVNPDYPTTNQAQYAQILGAEIQADMLILDSDWEHSWFDRGSSITYTPYFNFGAISTSNNSNEFDATMLLVAFEDNQEDAELMRDPKVRDAVGRSCVHGIVKFLNSLEGSTIPLDFAPMPPRKFQAVHNGSGGVVLTWIVPLVGEAYGDAPTGYRVYRSTNGYGFDGGTDVGNLLGTTLTDVPASTTTYFRVAAYNSGGESMPSETLAIRHSGDEVSTFLIVNGFDANHRWQDLRQDIPYYGVQDRPIWRHVNAFDYVVQHAEALAAAGATFDSCSNEAVISGDVVLDGYGAVVWMCGEESTIDETFDATEQSLVIAYLNSGGNLFVSGAEIAWDLVYQGSSSDQSFYNNYLKADYASDDANTYDVTVTPGSIFDGIGAFSFDNGTLLYDAEHPDMLNTYGGSTSALSYSGGTGGTAGVVYDGSFKVVNFGFPFETITSAAAREDIMERIIGFFRPGFYVIINEFNYDDMGTDNYAFIELHNFGATPIDISNWTIDIGDTGDTAIYYTVTIPAGETISAGGYWTVGKTDVTGISGAVVDLIDDSLNIGDVGYHQADANGQTYIALREPGGVILDAVAVEMNKGMAFGPPELAADIYAQIGTGIWGNHVNAENPLTSQSRWLDGLDTDNNGRDFGIQKATPGFSNNQADLMLPTYTENADALTPTASVPDWVFSYMPLRAVDPTVAGSLNPSAIAASPDGGNAMIGWDEAGGGNACYMSQLAKEDFTLETYIYIPPTYSPVGWGYEEARIGIRGSTCGVHNFGYANGSTGVCWFWQRGESWQILWLFDENDGNDATWPAPYSYARYLGGVTIAENDPNTTGWQRLLLETSGDKVRGIFGGTYGSRGDGIKFSGTHDAPGPGGIYVSYREAMSGTGIPENRPPTLDAITLTDPPLDGDMDLDDDVDLTDLVKFIACMNGPDVSTPPGGCTLNEFGLADLQWDNDVDLGDFAEFQMVFP
ncbi:MAG: lamin tail domain-containing protein [Phycisphaerales bacterium]|nr:MAG: lamin tail domain-containing protein [Phycisphaerales bacterium]